MIKINENMYQIVVPYKDIWTTVNLIKTEKGNMLFDSASYDDDAEKYTIPFLNECGVTQENLKYIFISHNHLDHAGGLHELIKHFPNTTIISGSESLKEKFADYNVVSPNENEEFLDVLKVIKIKGHTEDSAALLDTRTKTLISGDCMQAIGIVGSGNWAANISFPVEYFEALDKIYEMDIKNIVTAHNYYPFTKNVIEGKEEVENYIGHCYNALVLLKNLIVLHPMMNDEDICKLHNISKEIPSFGPWVVKSLRSAIESGKF